jgi:hypothetical protein
MHMRNHLNQYAETLGPLLEECPKAVLAAIAVSFGTQGGSFIDHAATAIAREWRVLHGQGIVPQAPSKAARAADDGRAFGEPFGPADHEYEDTMGRAAEDFRAPEGDG